MKDCFWTDAINCRPECVVEDVLNLYASDVEPNEFGDVVRGSFTASAPSFGPSNPTITLSCPCVHINRDRVLSEWWGNCGPGPINLYDGLDIPASVPDWWTHVTAEWAIKDTGSGSIIASGTANRVNVGYQQGPFYLELISYSSSDILSQADPEVPYFDTGTLYFTYSLASPSSYTDPDVPASQWNGPEIIKEAYC